MSSLHDSSVGDFTRGGQVLLHFLRMIGQVLRKFGGALLVLYVLGTIALWLVRTDPYARYLGLRHVGASIGMMLGNDASPLDVELRDGRNVRTSVSSFAGSANMQRNVRELVAVWLSSMAVSAIAMAVLMAVLLAWLFRFGAAQRREQIVRGGTIVEAPVLARQLSVTGRAGHLRLAGVPLLRDAETSHLLLTGSPGTGKTTAIQSLLAGIRARGERVICYSPSGDFIEWFHRPDRDHLLNPFDARCPAWDLWDECRAPFQFDMLAAALVPDPVGHGDPFWHTAARTLIASLARTMRERGQPSIDAFLDLLSQASLTGLRGYLDGTEAAALIDPAAEKTAASIRTTAATYARALRYLPRRDNALRIRQWVEADAGDGWIFLNGRPDQLSSVRPLLSAWLEIFTNALMSLPASRSRRVWLVIDELPSLNRIPSLPDFLAQSRKYGGCGVIAFQQLAQLRERYGRDGAEAVAGLCATWVCLRQNDPDTARWVAQSFGETEVLESQQGLSYGANDMRDGVSLSATRRMRPLVLPTQIAQLDNLEGFLRLPGDLPAAHFRLQRSEVANIAPAFVPGPDVDGQRMQVHAADAVADDSALDFVHDPPIIATRD
jgi:type IV conjugative transfer system coupling protein TraD